MVRKWWVAICAAGLGLCLNANAKAEAPRGTHVVTFAASLPVKARREAIEASGGKVLKELPLVDGLVVEFAQVRPSLAGLRTAVPAIELLELNTYRKWIEVSAVPLMSVPAALKAANAGAAAPPVDGANQGPAPAPKRSETPWGVERVKAPGIWETTRGAGVKVAVIDTGIDAAHPDIAPNYKGGYNAIDSEKDPTDDHGHGTHVAGTIAAAANGKGVIGVAPEASLYAVKVLDGEGGGTIGTIIDGIDWAVKNGMNVVNMSLGGPHSEIMHKAVKAAYAKGVTIVAASGNDPDSGVSAPAMYPETIGVSASTKENELAGFSSTGKQVDFIAPGQAVLSAWPGSRLAELSGTSMASPHVAGLAVLAYSLGAHSPAKIRRALKSVAVPMEGLKPEQQGAGMIEADRWLR